MNVWGTLVYLQVLDVLSTAIIILLSGSEMNPLIRLVISRYGLIWGLAIKLVLVWVIVVIGVVHNRSTATFKKIVKIANYMYAVVVLWNLSNLSVGLYLIKNARP